ncbi:MAG TPA: potassium-transporting ATPase subunit KdpC [Rhodanobacter sp.]|jgi:K+-transporting ATPase ATPase C chain|nr:potassium-transporting ATPase subunit KdpC [Rhodanobacter sp.]
MYPLIRPALILFVLLSAITGIIYPLATFAIAQVGFPAQANGSIVKRGGQPIGSRLIGQASDAPGLFQGRPSATSPTPYDGMASGGSNLGPSNPALAAAVTQRAERLHAANPEASGAVPVELVLASASGLDPDISPRAALWQAPRVARMRGLPLAQVRELVARHTQPPVLGLFGEARVNVLALNLALDDARPGVEDNPRR